MKTTEWEERNSIRASQRQGHGVEQSRSDRLAICMPWQEGGGLKQDV
jgi:hypothetical protein